MRIYLPFLGEFGGELLTVVPRIHADDQPKIVCCEQFKECLYPSASEHYIIDIMPETFKGTTGSRHDKKIFDGIKKHYGNDYEFVNPLEIKNLIKKVKWFAPKVNDFGFKTDVVLFPRKKTYRPTMNWDGWIALSEKLKSEGIKFFAAGLEDSSYHLDCSCAWDFEDNLGATIWAIINSKIRIGVITALHVLSMMCGKPVWVLTTKEGYMHSNTASKPNLSYLQYADHLKVGYEVIPYLDSIDSIVDRIKNQLI